MEATSALPPLVQSPILLFLLVYFAIEFDSEIDGFCYGFFFLLAEKFRDFYVFVE